MQTEVVQLSEERWSPTRTITLAFRLSVAERQMIDAEARRAGITASEFARQAVVGSAYTNADAIADAVERGRAETRWHVASLEGQLSVTQQQVAEARNAAKEWRLYGLLQANRGIPFSGELQAACIEVVSGFSKAQIGVATIWSNVAYRQRLKLLPIIAAAVEHEFHQMITLTPVSAESLAEGSAIVLRVQWLIAALDPWVGVEKLYPDKNRAESPLEQALGRIKEEVRLRFRSTGVEPDGPALPPLDPVPIVEADAVPWQERAQPAT